MYMDGFGVLQDDAEAVKWLTGAAQQGLTEAQAYLGMMYEEGRGVTRNKDEAARWYGTILMKGLETEASASEARELFGSIIKKARTHDLVESFLEELETSLEKKARTVECCGEFFTLDSIEEAEEARELLPTLNQKCERATHSLNEAHEFLDYLSSLYHLDREIRDAYETLTKNAMEHQENIIEKSKKIVLRGPAIVFVLSSILLLLFWPRWGWIGKTLGGLSGLGVLFSGFSIVGGLRIILKARQFKGGFRRGF